MTQLLLSDTDVQRIADAVVASLHGVAQRLQPPAAADEWLTVEQAAQHLKCSTSRIYQGTSKRTLPFHRDGGRLMFSKSELDNHLRGR